MPIKPNQLTPIPEGFKITRCPSTKKQAPSLRKLRRIVEEHAKQILDTEDREYEDSVYRAENPHLFVSEDGTGYDP